MDGKHADPEKLQPLIFAPGTRNYYTVGPMVAKGFSVGKKFLKE